VEEVGVSRFSPLLICSLLFGSGPAWAGELLLPAVEVATAEALGNRELAVWPGPDRYVRLRLARDPGEQTGPQDTWPRETLFVLVLPVDGSERRYYALDKAFGWSFRRWVPAEEVPAIEPSEGAGEDGDRRLRPAPIVFEVARRDINRSDPGQLWEERVFQVRVEERRALIREVPAP
jgi:hypothetical protein